MLFSTQEGKKKTEEIAKQLKERGEIEEFYWLDDLWREPEFTVVAHEIATKCALKFKELLEYNTGIRNIVRGEFDSYLREFEFYRLLSFFYNLTSSLLANLHFDLNIIWEYERHSPIRYEEVKGMTSQWVSEEDREMVKRLNKPNIPSFLERFIHTFFNCLGLQWIPVRINEEIRHTYLEGEVIRRILDSQLWFELGSTLK